MKCFRLLLPALALLTASSDRALATVLLSDNFDSYANQGAFTTAWPIVTGTGGTLSTTQAQSPTQSINLGTAAGRNDRSFTETGNPSATNGIRFSFDFYDTSASASPYRQIATLIDGVGSSSGQLISLGMNNNQSSANSGGNRYMARILGYNITGTPPVTDPDGGPAEEGTLGTAPFFKLNDSASAPLRSTGWHNLKVEITLNAIVPTSQDFTFYVDGVKSELVTLAGLTLRSYDSIRIGSGLSSVNQAFIDNILVETFTPTAVPEASSFLAVGMCVALAWFGKKRMAA